MITRRYFENEKEYVLEVIEELKEELENTTDKAKRRSIQRTIKQKEEYYNMLDDIRESMIGDAEDPPLNQAQQAMRETEIIEKQVREMRKIDKSMEEVNEKIKEFLEENDISRIEIREKKKK